jgi:hypothetical protein
MGRIQVRRRATSRPDGRPKDVRTVRWWEHQPGYGLGMSEMEGEHRRRRVRGSRPGRLSRGTADGDPSTDAAPGPDVASGAEAPTSEAQVTDALAVDTHMADAHMADAHMADAHMADAHMADAHMADAHTADAPTGEPPNATATLNRSETANGGARSGPVPAPSRLARFGAKRSAEHPRPEPRPWSRGGADRPTAGTAASDRAGRSERPGKTDPDARDRITNTDRGTAADRGTRADRPARSDRGTRVDRGAAADGEPFDSHTPSPTEDHERGLRGLIGGGSSQVSVNAAMRARDASRPTDADIANAEQTLAIVHRGWVPRD